MSEVGLNKKEFFEVGDQLILKVEGLPVGYAEIIGFGPNGAVLKFDREIATLPMAVFDYEEDGGMDE